MICLLGGSECLFTSLDLDRVCSEVMTAKSPCLVGTSDDAGRLVNLLYSYFPENVTKQKEIKNKIRVLAAWNNHKG